MTATLDQLASLRSLTFESERVTAVIRRGAETIPVSVLEDTLAAHPDVVHEVVVGMPDARLGKVPVACVQTHDGKPLRLAHIMRCLRAPASPRNSGPGELHLFDDWPLGATGKIDRRLIIARLQQDSESRNDPSQDCLFSPNEER